MYNEKDYPDLSSEKDLISLHDQRSSFTEPEADFKKRNLARDQRRGMLCFNLSVLFQLVLLATCIVFGLWLNARVQELEKKLEDSLNGKSQAGNAQARGNCACVHNALDPHDTIDDMKSAHHGIANGFIAHIYGDADTLRKYNFTASTKGPTDNDPEDTKLIFRKRSTFPELNNSVLLLNSFNDLWHEVDRSFALGNKFGEENRYRYFKQAAWMADDDSNYDVLENSLIQVKTRGMYQLHGFIQFILYSGIQPEGRMTVMKKENGTSSGLASCDVEVAKSTHESRYYHCSVYQVAMLERGVTLYLDIRQYSFFSIDPDLLHFTVMKLNDGSAHVKNFKK